MSVFTLHRGDSPLLISIPHAGTEVPRDLLARFTRAGRALPDTDRHVDRLYDFAPELGASVIAALHSRYVIDLNRPPDGAPLYPGADETDLCPTTTFTGEAIYRDGEDLAAGEISARLQKFWRPYHQALADELVRLRKIHGFAVLWEAHSIASHVPRFFAGRLPDYNFGSGGGTSADPRLACGLLDLARELGHEAVLDERFKGGYITRHYGKPAEGVHAVQVELTWRNYMAEAPPFDFDPQRAGPTRKTLRSLLQFARDFRPV